MEPCVTVDRSQRPIIIVTFTGAVETPENFEQYLRELNRNYDAKEPIGLVFNAQSARIPSRVYQKRQADWMRAHDGVIKSYCKGIAYIVPNPILRSVLKLIFAMHKAPAPSRVFESEQLGVKWLQSYLTVTHIP